MADKKVKRCALVCGSSEFDREWFKGRISGYDSIIAADGGYDNCVEAGVLPDIVIGDFDSVNANIPPETERITYPTHKDEPDFELCLRYCAEMGFCDIDVYCALGARLDHTLSAIFTAVNAKNNDNRITLLDKKTVVYAVDDVCKLKKGSKYVSVFAIGKKASGVTLDGFEYILNDDVLDCCVPLGLSNRVIESEAVVSVADGKLAVVEIL